ncbi:MAG: porin [Phycisphaerales bacterium]
MNAKSPIDVSMNAWWPTLVLLAATGAVAPPTLASARTQEAPPAAPPVDPEVIELRNRVKQLEQKVGELEAKDEHEWLSERRAAEIRACVQDTLADADTRASLRDTGATAGWDNGFFISSADGNFLLRIAGQIQFRFVYNHQNDSPTDDNRYGFEIRRAKLSFRGHIVDPTWEYELELDGSRSTGGVSEGENIWMQKDFGGGFKVRAGQFKPMYLREEAVSSKRLLTVERSLVNSQFTTGTAQGVQAAYETERWRVFAAFLDGFNSQNTAWDTEDTEFSGTARIELLGFGKWKTIDDDVSFRDSEPALLFGGAISYQRGEYGTGSNLPPPDFNNSEVDNFGMSADITWEAGGFSIAGALMYRNLYSGSSSQNPINQDQAGAVLRTGLFVTEDIELYAMGEWGTLDQNNIPDLAIVTVGVNKFFAKNSLKWQNDIGYGINQVGAPWAQSSAGWRADSPGHAGQLVVRSQFQLLF